MQPTITDRDRAALLAAALARVDDADLRDGAASLAGRSEVPRAVANALNALRRRGSMAQTIGRPPYRAVLPFVASAVSEECLARTIEVLGDNADDPSREQLLEALAVVGESYSDPVLAVMLASVASSDMPAADLCFDIATGDERFGLAGVGPASGAEEGDGDVSTNGGGPVSASSATMDDPAHDDNAVDQAVDQAGSTTAPPSVEQRAARRARRQAAADHRRRRQETAQRAAERVRSERKSERKKDRVAVLAAADETTVPPRGARTAPTLIRPPALTPAQSQEFDPGDPLVGAVVSAWVSFADEPGRDSASGADPIGPETAGDPTDSETGKARPCVVIAGAPEHLLVRPGYSDGGRKSRDWTSVPVHEWREAGLDQPTWIGGDSLRIARSVVASVIGRLSVADWNLLW
jgi:hypothetical protein